MGRRSDGRSRLSRSHWEGQRFANSFPQWEEAVGGAREAGGRAGTDLEGCGGGQGVRTEGRAESERDALSKAMVRHTFQRAQNDPTPQ